MFDWTKEAPHRLLPNKRARIQEDQERLTREETETASGGEGDYEEGQGGVTSRAIQVDVELICNHRFSVAILRSFCTTDTKEKKYFMLYTGFKSYSQFQETLEFVLPGLNRNNLIYWESNLAKKQKIDTRVLFGLEMDCESQSSEDEDEDDLDDKRTKYARQHKLTVEDEFLLFMMRLKLGLNVVDLSIRFGISEGTVSNIVVTWLNFLYVHLGHLKLWPHRNVIIDNMPTEFKKKYPTNIIIIDCTEIKIQTPSSLLKQSQSYSNYKSTNTLKSLIGVDAKGGIMYVSHLYTGSISDKEIVARSGFLQLLEHKLADQEILPEDAIMADKGFDIGATLRQMDLNLNIPPFLGAEAQFTESDVIKTQTVALHRVHVERAIGKVCKFGIFSARLPVSLLGTVNQLWTVCCILSNFMDLILE